MIEREDKSVNNELKKRTNKDYTAWDLNCPRIVNVKNRQKLEAKFKRKARRRMKQELKRSIENEEE